MTEEPGPSLTTVITSPPAKLNLFLEVPSKRDDGYHEIDTVMTAIDWRDELRVERSDRPGVELACSWLPSPEVVAEELGLNLLSDRGVLGLPAPEENLVTLALEKFRTVFGIRSGFSVTLGKRIPSGAGMGGASSDAAHALRCAARLHGVSEIQTLHQIAADLGSDVPLFLYPNSVCHAGGRGERLTPVDFHSEIHFVVLYPPVALSTAEVYRQLQLPSQPSTSTSFLRALCGNDWETVRQEMRNRLQTPAERILPRIGELLNSLWKSGLQTCQLTGSGSACFGIARNQEHAEAVAEKLKQEFAFGALVRSVRSVTAADSIHVVDDD